MKKIDLHLHTIASDGSFSSEELVKEAKDKGLTAIAITDHDTVDGVEDALKAGKKLGVEVVAGIEFTTYYQGKRIDILGYYVDYNNRELNKIIDNLQNDRELRAKKILDKLDDLGVELDFAKLKEISGEKGVGRPHIARLMVEEGYVKEMQEAFDDYLEDDGPAYVPKYQLKPHDAIDLIEGAGGVAILAHPGVIDDREIVLQLLEKDNFQGIEAYYSTHNEEETEAYLKLAKENNLLVTGGSDCHGPAIEDKYLIGTVDVSYTILEKLKDSVSET